MAFVLLAYDGNKRLPLMVITLILYYVKQPTSFVRDTVHSGSVLLIL